MGLSLFHRAELLFLGLRCPASWPVATCALDVLKVQDTHQILKTSNENKEHKISQYFLCPLHVGKTIFSMYWVTLSRLVKLISPVSSSFYLVRLLDEIMSVVCTVFYRTALPQSSGHNQMPGADLGCGD